MFLGVAMAFNAVFLLVDVDHVVRDGLARHSRPAAQGHGFVVLVGVEQLAGVQDDQRRRLSIIFQTPAILEHVCVVRFSFTSNGPSNKLLHDTNNCRSIQAKLPLQLTVRQNANVLYGIVDDDDDALSDFQSLWGRCQDWDMWSARLRSHKLGKVDAVDAQFSQALFSLLTRALCAMLVGY